MIHVHAQHTSISIKNLTSMVGDGRDGEGCEEGEDGGERGDIEGDGSWINVGSEEWSNAANHRGCRVAWNRMIRGLDSVLGGHILD